jgi:cation/acetate symporter
MGLAAILIVGKDGQFFEGGVVGGKILGGGNMVAMHLAKAVGGNLLLGFLAAVAFATILAVVSGLALAGASSISHDLYARVIKKGKATEEKEIRVSKIATICIGVVAVCLGLLFEKQNVAFMVGLAFAIACSANFPALLLSIVWRRFTTAGAVSSIVTGAVATVVLIVLSPTVWVDLLKNETAPFPLRNPAIVSMTLSILMGVTVSLLGREPSAEESFDDERLRTYLGVGAE